MTIAGCRLTNLKTPGNQPKHSAETIEKVRQASLNVSEKTRQLRSIAMKGKNKGPRTDEVKRKISEGRKGCKISSEARCNMSKARCGEKNPMYGKKRSPTFLGRKHTPETIEKIRIARRKREDARKKEDFIHQ